GRNLSGQTVEAFWTSVEHAEPFAVSINCSLGASEMRPYLVDLARIATVPVFCYPNAGLPNAFGGYDELPETMTGLLREFASSGLVNAVGSCCGSGPEHTTLIRGAGEGGGGGRAAGGGPGGLPRAPPQRPGALRDRPRDQLRDDRRANERDRVGPLPPPDRGRRLRGGAGDRAGAGARGRQPPGREHGCRSARLGAGDGPVPEPPRHPAGGGQAADRCGQLALLAAGGPV